MKRLILRIFGSVFLVALLFVFSRCATYAQEDDSRAAFMENASRVEVFRVKRGAPGALIGNCGIIKRGRVQGADFARRFAAILAPQLRKRHYFDSRMDECGPPEPVIALRFWKGAESLDLLLCFPCGKYQFLGSHERWQYARFGKIEFFHLLRQAFPGDKAIDALIESLPLEE